MLPFTRDQFFALFADYNSAVWPAQIVAYVLAIGMMMMLFRSSATRSRFIGAGLALMWLWTGLAYHWVFFSTINKAALLFGALFAVQGAGFLYAAVLRRSLRFGPSSHASAWLGWALIVYAGALYPALGIWYGHRYPEMPVFGITPCPVTIFTFGLLLLTMAPVSRWVLVIPVVWSLIGGSAAFVLGVPQDWLLLVSGVVVTPLLLLRDRAGASRVAAA